MLKHKRDRYDGVIVDHKNLPTDTTEFRTRLQQSLDVWTLEGKRGIWLRIPTPLSRLIPEAVEQGFEFHHAVPIKAHLGHNRSTPKEGYAMLTRWLATEEESMIPDYCSAHLGVGACVINRHRQVLVITEKYKHHERDFDFWKLPGGAVDVGEELWEGAVREVKEETGVDAHFISLLAMRHLLDFRFQRADLYHVCLLWCDDEHQVLAPQASEIDKVRWMEVEEFLDLPHLSFYWKPIRANLLRQIDRLLASPPSSSPSPSTCAPGAIVVTPVHVPWRERPVTFYAHKDVDDAEAEAETANSCL